MNETGGDKMTIMDDVRAAITKHLPAELGDSLRQRLEELEGVDERCDAAEAESRDLKKRLGEYLSSRDQERQVTRGWESREKELKDREEGVTKMEQILQVHLLQTQLQEAEKRADVVERLVDKVFSNPRLKFRGTVPVALEGSPGWGEPSDSYGTQPPYCGSVGTGSVDVEQTEE